MTGIRRLTALGVLLVVAGCATAGTPPSVFSTGVSSDPDETAARYRAALQAICVTGVTDAIRQRYEEAVRAADAAGQGGGRQSNFWGLRHPEAAYHDCFQSPGFL